jgi:hypothetical protein
MAAWRCEVASVDGFVQQLACNLINHGYWFYHRGHIPKHKDPLAVDQKLAELYDLALDKFARARRKKAGRANAAYLRYGREFILICTAGEHRLHDDHALLDVRRRPIHFHGYSIGCGKGSDGRYHASVRIADDVMKDLLAHFENIAPRRTAAELEEELRQVRFQPYARVRRQILRIVRVLNQIRAPRKVSAVSFPALRRTVTKVFNEIDTTTQLSDDQRFV